MDLTLSKAIFAPRSIAIVGASADAAKTASRPLRFLLGGGFPGKIYPINPRVAEIDGVRCWPVISHMPEPADLAFILLPSDAAIDAVAECGRAGIRAAMVLASGFGESGPAGGEREKRLAAAARETGIRLIGPSCLGLANLHENLVLTGNAAFAEPGQVGGGVFCASQSGSMIGALMSRGRAKGVNFAGLISVGGELDLSLGELCAATLDDPNVTSYMLFLETIRDAGAIRAFAAGAAARGKPVVALKLGRSNAAAELATSHTGGLAGEDDVADAFLADCGVARVDTLEGLLEAPALLRRTSVRRTTSRPPTVGVVTTTGGGAALIVDQLGMRDIAVEGPDSHTLAAIRASGVDVAPGRIVDLTLAGTRYDVMKTALEAMVASDRFDLVVAVAGSSARSQPDLAVKPIADVGREQGRLAAFLVPEAAGALAMLARDEVPAFRTPEACADVVAACLRRRPARSLDLPAPMQKQPARMLDELEGYDILDAIGVSHAAAAAYAPSEKSPDDALFPAAVKILQPALAHKTDVGGVVLGVQSPRDFGAAVERMRATMAERAPDLRVESLLVQKMTKGAVAELLLGYRNDKQVGPLVVLASGGIMTEVLRDRVIRMAPVDLEEARKMIAELKSFPLLTGFRGRPRADIEAAAKAIAALSTLALRPEVSELEINPLMVLPEGEGVAAVDAVTWLADLSSQETG
ncbi:MAG: acetate--CoA ligase family protein [Mesorhizobium sp.]|nr:MAG: acetate--CoA ligase family protein [Mesorhizobium sp.]